MLKRWTDISTKNNTHFWMQLSHAGRQTPGSINSSPLAPSRVRLKIPGRKFGHPVEMSTADIKNTISQFVFAAKAAKEVGFTGIQIHSAHGYLFPNFYLPILIFAKMNGVVRSKTDPACWFRLLGHVEKN